MKPCFAWCEDGAKEDTAMEVGQSHHESPNDRPEVGRPTVHLRVQTPRGLWSIDSPPDASKRPIYPMSTKVEQVIADARSVFGFIEEDSKYTLHLGDDVLEPQRTLASYRLENDALLVLSVQGGNA
jgi:hypothetical protein